MSKSPYELRTEILAIAKDYMDKQYEANYNLAQRLINAGPYNHETIQKMMTIYTPEELLAQAENFYQKFVCQGEKK
jgi:DNA-binding SARP family transcriptional activator